MLTFSTLNSASAASTKHGAFKQVCLAKEDILFKVQSIGENKPHLCEFIEVTQIDRHIKNEVAKTKNWGPFARKTSDYTVYQTPFWKDANGFTSRDPSLPDASAKKVNNSSLTASRVKEAIILGISVLGQGGGIDPATAAQIQAQSAH